MGRDKITYSPSTERWGIWEICIQGPECGNPFTEQWIKGRFYGKSEEKSVSGFYDGEGCYRLRFMPSFEGTSGSRRASGQRRAGRLKYFRPEKGTTVL